MSVATAYKVRVKLGQAEFDAEGPEDTVKQDFAAFLEIAPSYATAPAKGQGSDRSAKAEGFEGFNLGQFFGAAKPVDGNGHVSTPSAAPEPPASISETSVEPQVIKRLFKEDANDLISLRVLPTQSEDKVADTLFLLMFGFHLLKSQSEVKASDLLVCARQSGIALARIDHALEKARYQSLFTRGGTRSGSRYALTNPGIAHAEAVASKVFG